MPKKKRKKGKIEKIIGPDKENKPYVFYLEDSNKRFSIFNERPGKEGDHIDFNYIKREGDGYTFYNVTDINSQSNSKDFKKGSEYNTLTGTEAIVNAIIFNSAVNLSIGIGKTENNEIIRQYSELKEVFEEENGP